jgi:hypothetical protein
MPGLMKSKMKAINLMPYKLAVAVSLMFFTLAAHAQEKTPVSIDLIEMLGEMDEEDRASLETAMADIKDEPAKSKEKQKIKSPNDPVAGVKK